VFVVVAIATAHGKEQNKRSDYSSVLAKAGFNRHILEEQTLLQNPSALEVYMSLPGELESQEPEMDSTVKCNLAMFLPAAVDLARENTYFYRPYRGVQ
jgi:hypothetical protein